MRKTLPASPPPFLYQFTLNGITGRRLRGLLEKRSDFQIPILSSCPCLPASHEDSISQARGSRAHPLPTRPDAAEQPHFPLRQWPLVNLAAFPTTRASHLASLRSSPSVPPNNRAPSVGPHNAPHSAPLPIPFSSLPAPAAPFLRPSTLQCPSRRLTAADKALSIPSHHPHACAATPITHHEASFLSFSHTPFSQKHRTVHITFPHPRCCAKTFRQKRLRPNETKAK
jgi:hypothetical protein